MYQKFAINIYNDNAAAGNGERENDRAQILITAEGENQSYFVENAAKRSDASYTVDLPVNFQAKTIHSWMAFRLENGDSASNSQYAGSIE